MSSLMWISGNEDLLVHLSLYLHNHLREQFPQVGRLFFPRRNDCILSVIVFFSVSIRIGHCIGPNKSFIFPPKRFAPKGSYLCSPTAPGEVFMVRRWAERYDAPCFNFFNVPHTAPDSARQTASGGSGQRQTAPAAPTRDETTPSRPSRAPAAARAT